MADASVSAPGEPGPSERPSGGAKGAAQRIARRFFWPGGLSSRLLILTLLLVSLGGLLILPLFLAAFEESWLEDRVVRAELATLAVEARPISSGKLSREVRTGAGVVAVAVWRDGVQSPLLPAPKMTTTPYLVDLREGLSPASILAPFETLFSGKDRMVRVRAKPRFRNDDFVDVVASDAPLKDELVGYLLRLLATAVVIATVTGGLIYLLLNALFVRPMQRITRAMERFRADPDDPLAQAPPSHRRDEIGRAEDELARMQADLRAALNSRARLAALGEAVAKINHDLRNMLTSAQIASERLAQSGDPKVAQALPRLERALDRAVKLASDVLAYGRSEEAAPAPVALALAPALEAAAEDAGLTAEGVRLESRVDPRSRVSADPDQLHRILVNLLRNAREAIQSQTDKGGAGRIEVSLRRQGQASVIRIADNGPGVPERLQQRLFQPFSGSGRPGGAGLGLAIARELAQAHGGDVALVQSGPNGAVFELRLPGAPAPSGVKRRG